MITGSAGYVGSYLAKKLNGKDLLLLDNYSALEDGRPAIFEINGKEIIKADITNAQTCDDFTKGVDVIFHLAAVSGIGKCENPDSYASNVIGTAQLAMWAEKNEAKKIIFASTSAVYGECQNPIITETHRIQPRSRYGWEKFIGEQILQSLKIPCVILRISNVFGEGLYHKQTAADNFIDKAKAGLNLTINGKGTQRRDYIHIDDMVEAYHQAIYWDSGIYNIGGNDNLSINELADMVIEGADKHLKLKIKKIYNESADAGRMLKKFTYACTKAKERGFTPKKSIKDEIQKRFAGDNCSKSL